MMSSSNETLERIARRIQIPGHTYERILHRRDHKRRNQRITAGVVGLAVLAATVAAALTLGSYGRSQPGASGDARGLTTGSTATGPTESCLFGPPCLGFDSLPPESAAPSQPVHGILAMSDSGIHPGFAVNLYDDGRLIWFRQEGGYYPNTWFEQRLTPEGVELLRSRAVPLGGQFEDPGQELPTSAWEDRELRPYVASKYAVLPWATWGRDPARALGLLPAAAQDLLRGTQRTFDEIGGGPLECFGLTIEEARALAEILTYAGFARGDAGPAGMLWFSESGEFKDDDVIELVPVLPDGSIVTTVGG